MLLREYWCVFFSEKRYSIPINMKGMTIGNELSNIRPTLELKTVKQKVIGIIKNKK